MAVKNPGSFLGEIKKNFSLYLLMVPGILFFFVFSYLPMGGLVIAFQEFNLIRGVFGSNFAGLANFKFLFVNNTILKVMLNTLYLNILFIVFTTFTAVTLAIMFSEIRHKKTKRFTQTISILPYFISWAVIALFLQSFLQADGGIIPTFLSARGVDINFYSSPQFWPFILVVLRIWQGAGYMAVVYIAAITGMDTGIFEAARIDGASRLQIIMRITIPYLRPVVILMTLFSVGRIFYGDFGMIYGIVQDNALLFSTTDVIDTYVYRMLRSMSDYGMATAVGMLQSVFGLIFVYSANLIARRLEPGSAIF
ncbi:MAG: ABC transporter permease subunit [Treponema sp.]|jgi:putative aldouronate transport system permease protein|nr:ABC transporter permease subunit [Treponema sp.]